MLDKHNDVPMQYDIGGGTASDYPPADTTACPDSLATIMQDVIFLDAPLCKLQQSEAEPDS